MEQLTSNSQIIVLYLNTEITTEKSQKRHTQHCFLLVRTLLEFQNFLSINLFTNN